MQSMTDLKYAEVAGWLSLAVATPLLFHIPLPSLGQHVRRMAHLSDHEFKRDEFHGSERDGCW